MAGKPVIRGTRLTMKQTTLERLLAGYAERLSEQFVVVSERRVRFARGDSNKQ